jgi:hypothetical protein
MLVNVDDLYFNDIQLFVTSIIMNPMVLGISGESDIFDLLHISPVSPLMPVVGLITHMAKLVHTTILVGQWDDTYSNPNNLPCIKACHGLPRK